MVLFTASTETALDSVPRNRHAARDAEICCVTLKLRVANALSLSQPSY